MFSSRVVARALCACLGFLFVAGSAQAQLESCPLPTEYPSVVLTTVGEAGDIDFGNLTQKVCDSIVKKGVATCKAQVKAAAKCAHKVAGSIYDIQVKQCAQMMDAADRADCKQGAKTFRDFNVEGYDNDLSDALALCDGMFATLLNAGCMDLVIKVGGP